MKTVNITLTCADAKVHYEGGAELELIGRTPGDQSVKVKIQLGPSTVGYLAERLHKIVKDYQRTLERVQGQLRGDQ